MNKGVIAGIVAMASGALAMLASLSEAQDLVCKNWDMFCPGKTLRAEINGAGATDKPTDKHDGLSRSAERELTRTVAPTPVAVPLEPQAPQRSPVQVAWDRATEIGTQIAYQDFAAQYPDSPQAETARRMVSQLQPQQTATRREYVHQYSNQQLMPADVAVRQNASASCHAWAEREYPDSGGLSNALAGCAQGVAAYGEDGCGAGVAANLNGASSSQYRQSRLRIQAYEACVNAGGPPN